MITSTSVNIVQEILNLFQIEVSGSSINPSGILGHKVNVCSARVCERVLNDHSNECEQWHLQRGLFQIEVSDDLSWHGCTIFDLEYDYWQDCEWAFT